jgi:hypothetical protein
MDGEIVKIKNKTVNPNKIAYSWNQKIMEMRKASNVRS